jgi:hypothetical protein
MPDFQMLSEVEEEALLPRVLPAGWVRLEAAGPAFDCHGLGELRGLRVLVSAGIEEDGRRWLHVSVSRPNRCPSWEDMDAVKRIFVGDHRVAYQVHPPRAEHYNALPAGGGPRWGTVLHLWAPLEGEPPLPSFLRARGGTL